MTHEEWEAAISALWEKFLRQEVTGPEYVVQSLKLGPDPDWPGADEDYPLELEEPEA